jgi:AbrB family looped-hinge helix DNA binding protein
MSPIVSTITTKAQTTIPREVRQRLGLGPGDKLIYEIEGEAVRIRKAPVLDLAYLRALQATLSEWDSPEDEAAYGGL